MQDNQITIGAQVKINESDRQAPFNGAIGTVVEIGEYDHAPVYVVDLYSGRYNFRAYDLEEAE